MSLLKESIFGSNECVLPSGETCTLCCYASYIPELSKPPMENCEYQTENGCGIQGEKPEVCARYECGNSPDHIQEYFIDVAERIGSIDKDTAEALRDNIFSGSN